MAYKDWEALKTFVIALDDDEIDILQGIVEDLERDSSTMEGAIILGIVNQILGRVNS